ncbi:Alpha/Beta hydrolase protein [Zopfochytrium polystomum]|nr:Alpha/Beta hydrolase protein [Zopfochytrium polystomum]
MPSRPCPCPPHRRRHFFYHDHHYHHHHHQRHHRGRAFFTPLLLLLLLLLEAHAAAAAALPVPGAAAPAANDRANAVAKASDGFGGSSGHDDGDGGDDDPKFAASTTSTIVRDNKVHLSYGTFNGFTTSPYDDGIDVRVHLGIPYAEPPVGDLRFLAPRRIKGNLGERNATSYGATCIQNVTSIYPFEQSEDCMFINVFRPAKIPHGTKLPVMVWVYGGNFDSGSSSFAFYDGSTLVHRSIELGQEVIVVTFNYRSGVFGFLASPEIQASGGSNAGLRDQVAAFRWVRAHIGAFGGNASMVTAFGESAGSISIANHLTAAYQPADGYARPFDAAILESGGVHGGLTPNWTTVYRTLYAGVAAATACPSNSFACLRAVPAADLLAAQNRVESLLSISGGLFRPYVDGDYIPANPQGRLLTGDFLHVPVLIGTNTDEGTLFTASVATQDDFAAFVNTSIPGLPRSVLDQAYALYPLADYAAGPAGPAAAPFLAAADIFGDFVFQCPSQRLADAYAQLSRATDPADPTDAPLVFRYRFNRVPAWIPADLRLDGAAHSYEVPYVFAATLTSYFPDDAALARDVAAMWLRFGSNAGAKGLAGWGNKPTADAPWPKYRVQRGGGPGGGERVRIDGPGQYLVEVDDGRAAKCTLWNAVSASLSTP